MANGSWKFDAKISGAQNASGVVVLHYFNTETGELDHTKKYRDPKRPVRPKGVSQSTAVPPHSRLVRD